MHGLPSRAEGCLGRALAETLAESLAGPWRGPGVALAISTNCCKLDVGITKVSVGDPHMCFLSLIASGRLSNALVGPGVGVGVGTAVVS